MRMLICFCRTTFLETAVFVSDDPVLSLWYSFLGQIALLLTHVLHEIISKFLYFIDLLMYVMKVQHEHHNTSMFLRT